MRHVPADPPRLLHRRSQYGYTDDASFALIAEPEAISAQAQREITESSHRARAEALVDEWVKARTRVVGALDHFERVGRPPDSMRSDLRVIARVVERVDRDLGVSA
jgi:hypothetical protein